MAPFLRQQLPVRKGIDADDRFEAFGIADIGRNACRAAPQQAEAEAGGVVLLRSAVLHPIFDAVEPDARIGDERAPVQLIRNVETGRIDVIAGPVALELADLVHAEHIAVLRVEGVQRAAIEDIGSVGIGEHVLALDADKHFMPDRAGGELAAQAGIHRELFAAIVREVIGPGAVAIRVYARDAIALEGYPGLPIIRLRIDEATDGLERERIAQALFEKKCQREAVRIVGVEARRTVIFVRIDFPSAGSGEKRARHRQELMRGVGPLFGIIGEYRHFGTGSGAQGERRRDDELVVIDLIDLGIGIAQDTHEPELRLILSAGHRNIDIGRDLLAIEAAVIEA